ncbi:oxidoreductase [Paraburkholderia solisilvae]|uniref:3-phenylpropionate-dihydrodiol/cinnamic acid-dihydrodiol dehydrogenase n=1 Tax=Paraburkholderia solisilvae TaxID=624376 RepID=A0A6J5ESL6_9BURK|nr:oxidoreductase [Paraburkholderia solisilvae]CAB3769578.1 3-phenylpropionate-dihydrodiol/cinnamic acid-dihydrodiol dehydrogenase [Paraburkholderia solisilvae]
MSNAMSQATSQANAGKVWFITGASRGFGALIARDALQRGDRVVATARNPQTVVEQLGDHPNLLAVKLDVTNEAEAAQAVEVAIARFSRIDVLLNNAGYGLLGAVEEASDNEVKAVFNTNVFGLLTVTRAVLPQMRKQKSGHVINISSIGGYSAYQGWGVYGATKFAVEGLTEALAAELAPLNVHATVVEPGFFRTDFLNDNSLVSTKQQIADYAETVGVTRDVAAGANHAQPGDPQKLAAAMLKLVDSANPPVRLPLGSDTVARINAKNRHVEQELETWRALAVSTDIA